MGKNKHIDNQAWLAWLSDEVNDAPKQATHSLSTDTEQDAGTGASKLKSAHRIRLKTPSSLLHGSSPATSPMPTKTLQNKHNLNNGSVSSGRAIDISITIPKIHLPKPHAVMVSWSRVARWGGLVVTIIVALVITPYIVRHKSEQAQKNTAINSVTPAYAPLTPTGDDGSVSGAQYDSKRKLYKYNDTYKGVSLTISQQPLPDTLRQDKTKLKDIAKASIGATEKFETVHGDVYITTDETTGMQRMIVSHRQLLIFIQSAKTLSTADWVIYVQALE